LLTNLGSFMGLGTF